VTEAQCFDGLRLDRRGLGIHGVGTERRADHGAQRTTACEAGNCSLWFLDVSKGHARRWCSMAICGNRAKAAAHRARARQGVTAQE
jgi:hypothetical protein